MELVTIINQRKNMLYKQYEDQKVKIDNFNLDQMHVEINLVIKVLNDLSKDYANLRCIDIEKVLDLLYSNLRIEQARDELEEQLRIIKIIFSAKYDEQLDINITENQRLILENFKQFIEKLKFKLEGKFSEIKYTKIARQQEIDAIQDDIIGLEIVYEKVLGKEKQRLTPDDFQQLYKIVEDPKVPYKTKKDLLIAIRNYNIRNIGDSEIEINTVKDLFKRYGVDKKIFKYIDKCWDEINNNLDLDNINAILNYLSSEDESVNKHNILSKFDVSTLLAITIYGTLESVKSTYEKIINSNQDAKIFFQTASVWVNNLTKKRTKKRENPHRIPPRDMTPCLYNQAHEISYEELLSNERFLQEMGFSVSIKLPGSVKVLKTPLYKLKENYEICELYGLFPEDKHEFTTSVLWFSNLVYSCDRFIELGLFHCPDAEIYPYADTYIRKYPSAMNAIREGTIALLYKLKQTMSCDSYYETIFSKKHPGMLSLDLTSRDLGNEIKSEDQFRQFKEENFIDQRRSMYIPNYNVYEDIIFEENNYKIDQSIMSDSFIKKLDDEYKPKNNDYIYLVGSQIISRFKVLRIYSILKKNNLLMDDAKLFALTYASYINEEVFSMLANVANYSYNGGSNGISKTI